VDNVSPWKSYCSYCLHYILYWLDMSWTSTSVFYFPYLIPCWGWCPLILLLHGSTPHYLLLLLLPSSGSSWLLLPLLLLAHAFLKGLRIVVSEHTYSNLCEFCMHSISFSKDRLLYKQTVILHRGITL